MRLTPNDFREIRSAIAAIPADISNDAVGAYSPKLGEMYAPETHAAALDPGTPIVVGPRGAGKSFWSGVLGQKETRMAASKAYPRLGLDAVIVGFGFTGIGGPDGIGVEALNANIPMDANADVAKAFWWATILRAAGQADNSTMAKLADLTATTRNWELREEAFLKIENDLRSKKKTLLVVYDALDMLATNWPRRRLLTEALLEVVWSMRAYRSIRLKLFLRPDQLDDDGLRFLELPKLRTGAVRLAWSREDLYGLLFARMALTDIVSAKRSFNRLLRMLSLPVATEDDILTRHWVLSHSTEAQISVVNILAGKFMADGPNGYKKGKTYDWPIIHLADAFDEVTPRSFLGLKVSAAKYGPAPEDRAINADGIRHGLRAASKTRVDQLHQEFPWIKGVLAPLAGLLLPQDEEGVYSAWRSASTVDQLVSDAIENKYLPPFSPDAKKSERSLFHALERIGVMFRRKDERLDMPDLFRVAAKLLKKGGTAPLLSK